MYFLTFSIVAALLVCQSYGQGNAACYKCTSDHPNTSCQGPLKSDKIEQCNEQNSRGVLDWLQRAYFGTDLSEKIAKSNGYECITFTVTAKDEKKTYRKECIKRIENFCDLVANIEKHQANTISDCRTCDTYGCNGTPDTPTTTPGNKSDSTVNPVNAVLLSLTMYVFTYFLK